MNQRLSTTLRIALVLLVVGGTIAGFAVRGALQPMAIRDHIGEYPLAPAIFVAIMTLASLVFVPRTILAAAAGLLFGLWWGFLWATLGSTAGAPPRAIPPPIPKIRTAH